MSLVKGCVTHSIRTLSSNRATATFFQHMGCVHLRGLLTQNPQPAFLSLPLSPSVRSGGVKRKPNFICLESGLLWYPEWIVYLFFCSLEILGIKILHVVSPVCSALWQPFTNLVLGMQSNLSCFLFPGLMGGLWECTFVGVFNPCSYRLGIP